MQTSHFIPFPCYLFGAVPCWLSFRSSFCVCAYCRDTILLHTIIREHFAKHGIELQGSNWTVPVVSRIDAGIFDVLQATFYHKLRINCCYWLSNASEMPYRTRIRFDFVPLATIHTSTVRFWFFRCCLPLICNWTQNINIQHTNSLVQTFCHRHIGFCCCLLFICRCFGRDWIIEFVYLTKLQVHAYWSSDRSINRRHGNKYGVWKSISQNCWNCRRRYKIYMKLNDKQMRYWWNLELFIFLETARETLIFWILIEYVRLERIERPGSFRNNKVTIWLLQLIHLSILSSSKNSQVYTKLSSTKTEGSGHENSVFVLWLEFFIQFLINYQLNTETKAIQSF